ncbi:unnamed protein product [Cuscuta epithymum]|uniref:Uncharacterized protein n=1 Tax=Cuscuta epithymum TaxID=186058 RepID=A0AAV0CEP2_9ASTE|nr:unnamed protein product [Cuscuta epithymum]
MFDHITASEIAGYAVGALLLCATISAPKIDSLFAAPQRSSLGMCKRCGDLKVLACRKCKGSGVIRPFNFIPPNDDHDYQLAASKWRLASSSCAKCQARGHFSCPECSKKLPQS